MTKDDGVNMNRGSTLLEIIITIIVIGVIASLAIPRLLRYIEKTRCNEGVKVLDKLRDAQIAYHYEHGLYATNVADLDVGYPKLQYFNTGFTSAGDNANTPTRLGRVRRRPPDIYELDINEDGDICCRVILNSSCAYLGFDTCT